MEADPERRFAYLWTRKEAVLKCTGAGLSQPMNAFSVLGDTASPEGALLSLYTVEYGNYMLSAAAGALGGIYAAARRCSGASVRRIRYGTERNRKSGRGSRAALAG